MRPLAANVSFVEWAAKMRCTCHLPLAAGRPCRARVLMYQDCTTVTRISPRKRETQDMTMRVMSCRSRTNFTQVCQAASGADGPIISLFQFT